ncbi:MAG: glycyl-radical enzyme activating protein [Bacteroidales bacterium]
MTGLIYDIKRFALHDGPGIRTTIFFKGCPLDCWWCHNPESRNPCIEKTMKINRIDDTEFEVEEITGYSISSGDLMKEILKDKAFMEESGGGVTFSGGEPFLQPEFLAEIIPLCKKHNIHVAIDTSGYVKENSFRTIAKETDLFLFDIKLIDEQRHMKYTSVSNDLIFRNLDYLHNEKIPVIIRFPIIRGVNDGEYLMEMATFLNHRYPAYRELHLLPFHNIADHKYERFGMKNRMKTVKPYTDKEIQEIAGTLSNYGFQVKTGG